MMEVISTKRQAFRAQIRSKQINAIMSKVRYQIRKEQRAQLINTIISLTEHRINFQQIRMLIKLGLQGEENAVIHFGNLIIDGIVTIQMIKQFESERPSQSILGEGEHYIWLLHVLYQRNYFRQQHLLHLVDYIIAKVQKAKKNIEMAHLGDAEIFLDHGLLLLKQIIKKHSSAAELIMLETANERNKKLFRAIYNICQASLNNKITAACYSILNTFSVAGTGEGTSFAGLMGEKAFMQTMKMGILRRESNIRCLTYQIINNSIIEQMPEIYSCLPSLLDSILNAWGKEKTSVQIQISYLILTIAEKLNTNLIAEIMTQFCLVPCIKRMVQNADIIEVTNNCLRTLCVLCDMFKESDDIRLRSQFLFDQLLQEKIEKYYANQ